jgi:acetolactate synthase-1/3 small subunit
MTPKPPFEEHFRVPRSGVVLRLVVRNHPGVMSHVCGLFARRGFNVEGILCLPLDDAPGSAVLLLVHEEARLDQLVSQLGKLGDVREIHRVTDGHAIFEAVAEHLRGVEIDAG